MYRILLVDDEILVREAIGENINWESLDCRLVASCQNGQEAAEYVKQHPVDIVLTDILMPYMDGMELSHFLHDNYPDIVVVIFSGFGEFEYAKKAIQYNVSEYMLKPVTAMELTAVLEKMKGIVDRRRKEKKRLETLTRNSEDYHKNALVIRSRTIEALVRCTRDISQSLQELNSMGITLDAPSYRVAVFDMDTYCELFQPDMEKRQESALMAFVLFNVTEEIVKQEEAGIAYQEGDSRVCVLFAGNHSREFAEQIHKICTEIQNKIRELIGIEVSMGIGKWVRSLQQLALSYETAIGALSYRYLLGGHLLLDMEEQKLNQNLSIQDQLEQLEGAVRQGKKESMDLLLADMEERICRAMPDKSRACLYLQQIVRAVGNVSESTESAGEIRNRQEELLHRITEQRFFTQATAAVKEYAQEIFEKQLVLNSSSGQRQAVMALDYIQNNYMDPSLSLNSICSYLNISTSYFSTIFKEETGETFTEVLIRTRMEKAKEFLENTTMKNYEIAEKVGFSDPHYFGISFKKMTGKTPTEYAREKRR